MSKQEIESYGRALHHLGWRVHYIQGGGSVALHVWNHAVADDTGEPIEVYIQPSEKVGGFPQVWAACWEDHCPAELADAGAALKFWEARALAAGYRREDLVSHDGRRLAFCVVCWPVLNEVEFAVNTVANAAQSFICQINRNRS